MRVLDIIIVGQGLAGTTLAWYLLDRGWNVALIDAAEGVSASRVAMGLVTPITGQRLALGWTRGELLSTAKQFYAGIEERTGQKFFDCRPAVRIFKSDEERRVWSKLRLLPTYLAHLIHPQRYPLFDPDIGDPSGGGIEMWTGHLDTEAYLRASRKILPYLAHAVDWRRDVKLNGNTVAVQGLKARVIVSCEGYAATKNPYLSWLRFNAAKGDILTVRFHRRMPHYCLHRNIWVVPTAEADVFRIGSTYDRATLDQRPCRAGREQIEFHLRQFIVVPYTVIDHQAAVRPISGQRRPLLGMHPDQKWLGYFNGLGSKGALLAPWYARAFSEYLAASGPLRESSGGRKRDL